LFTIVLHACNVLGKSAITLADARPELLMNQLTGGSDETHSMYIPVPTAVAVAVARQLLVEVAAAGEKGKSATPSSARTAGRRSNCCATQASCSQRAT
jgi:hypothetical protein